MPGSFVRVVTVTHHSHVTPGTGRKHTKVSRRTIIRPAAAVDRAPAWHWLMSWPVGGIAGPCGSNAVEPEHSAMRWTVAYLRDYAQHWGDNPLGQSDVARGRKGRKPGSKNLWASLPGHHQYVVKRKVLIEPGESH